MAALPRNRSLFVLPLAKSREAPIPERSAWNQSTVKKEDSMPSFLTLGKVEASRQCYSRFFAISSSPLHSRDVSLITAESQTRTQFACAEILECLYILE